MHRQGLLTTILALIASIAFAVDDPETQRLEALGKKCQEARTIKLKPIRARLVEKCVKEERRPRTECEVEISTYGENRSNASGRGVKPGLFYDLPECLAEFKAYQSPRKR